MADENASENYTGTYWRGETSKLTEDEAQHLVSSLDELDKFLRNVIEWVEVLCIKMRERLGEPTTTVSELHEEHRKYEILGHTLSNPDVLLHDPHGIAAALYCIKPWPASVPESKEETKMQTTIKVLEENVENEGIVTANFPFTLRIANYSMKQPKNLLQCSHGAEVLRTSIKDLKNYL